MATASLASWKKPQTVDAGIRRHRRTVGGDRPGIRQLQKRRYRSLGSFFPATRPDGTLRRIQREIPHEIAPPSGRDIYRTGTAIRMSRWPTPTPRCPAECVPSPRVAWHNTTDTGGGVQRAQVFRPIAFELATACMSYFHNPEGVQALVFANGQWTWTQESILRATFPGGTTREGPCGLPVASAPAGSDRGAHEAWPSGVHRLCLHEQRFRGQVRAHRRLGVPAGLNQISGELALGFRSQNCVDCARMSWSQPLGVTVGLRCRKFCCGLAADWT